MSTIVLESTALESTALESTALESTALESTATLARANMVERVTLDSLIADCQELRKLSVGQLQQHTPKEVATRTILRAFVSRALSGSAVDWQDKSIKGAMLTTAQTTRVKTLEPSANDWKRVCREEVINKVNELLITIHGAIAPTPTAKSATSELDKARKYISGLSPETLAALRKEGVI